MRLKGLIAVGLVLAAGAAAAGVEGEVVRPAIPASPEVAARAAALRLGHAEVVRFAEPVGTVIVGDSSILDATAVNDRTVVLTALTAGTTNVVVLGPDAEILSRLNVRVAVPQEPRSEVYRGRERMVLVCDPDCVPLGEAGTGRASEAEAAAVEAEPRVPDGDDPEVAEPGEPAE